MKSNNFSKWVKIVVLLVCLGGITGLGFYLKDRSRQIQQIKQADRLLAKKNYSAAIDAYNQILQTDIPQAHLLWINRGYAFFGLNKYDRMLQSCSEAVAIKPETALAWNCRGEALYSLKRDKEALEAFERAKTLDSQSIFWLNKAVVLDRLHKYEKSIAASEKAIELSSKSESQRAMQGGIGDFTHEGLHQEAIAFYQKGQSLLKTERDRQALVAFQKSLTSSPDYLPARQGKAVALYKLDRYEEASTAFEEILQSKDLTQEQATIAMLYRATSLCQIQKTAAAEEIFLAVIELTDNPQSQKIARTGCGIR